MFGNFQSIFFTSYRRANNGNVLPLSYIDNNKLFFEIENKTGLIGSTPSFTIKSLLDQMPGQNFETDEFITISSEYFTEFLKRKFSPNIFSMIHINLASLCKLADL